MKKKWIILLLLLTLVACGQEEPAATVQTTGGATTTAAKQNNQPLLVEHNDQEFFMTIDAFREAVSQNAPSALTFGEYTANSHPDGSKIYQANTPEGFRLIVITKENSGHIYEIGFWYGNEFEPALSSAYYDYAMAILEVFLPAEARLAVSAGIGLEEGLNENEFTYGPLEFLSGRNDLENGFSILFQKRVDH